MAAREQSEKQFQHLLTASLKYSWWRVFVLMLFATSCSVFWPEWKDQCDPGRPVQSCYIAAWWLHPDRADGEVELGFGSFEATSPDASVVFSKRGDVVVFRELTAVEIRSGDGPYNRLKCAIISEGPKNGGWSRLGCNIPNVDTLLSNSAPETLRIRLTFGLNFYERKFSLTSPRQKYAQVKAKQSSAQLRL